MWSKFSDPLDVFPACAGVIRTAYLRERTQKSVPRVCGGDPCSA